MSLVNLKPSKSSEKENKWAEKTIEFMLLIALDEYFRGTLKKENIHLMKNSQRNVEFLTKRLPQDDFLLTIQKARRLMCSFNCYRIPLH